MRKHTFTLVIIFLAILMAACGGNGAQESVNSNDDAISNSGIVDEAGNAETNNTAAQESGDDSGDVAEATEVADEEEAAPTETAEPPRATETTEPAVPTETAEPIAATETMEPPTPTATMEPPAPVGDAANGELLYNSATIGAAGTALGCTVCHSVQENTVIVGPSHFGVATSAESRVAGLTAEEYLRMSILDPNAYIVDGFAQGVMYQNYAQELSETEIDDLVAYLLTLK